MVNQIETSAMEYLHLVVRYLSHFVIFKMELIFFKSLFNIVFSHEHLLNTVILVLGIVSFRLFGEMYAALL